MAKNKRERNNRTSGIVGLGFAKDVKRNRWWMIGGAGFVLLVAISVFAADGWLPQSVLLSAIENVPDLATSVSAKAKTETPPTAKPTPDSQMKAELVVISPSGFEPDIIRRPAGRVLLVVVNDSNRPRITLRAETVGGALIRQIQMPRNKRRWQLPVNLPPGRFQIVDTERPNHILRIEITE